MRGRVLTLKKKRLGTVLEPTGPSLDTSSTGVLPMSSSIISGPGPLSNETPSPSRWLRLGEAARLLNLSESFLRKGTQRKKNPIPHIRLGEGGERRFNYGELCRFFGIQNGNGNGETSTGKIPVALIARVSGNKQSRGISKGSEDNDLARQIKRLEDFAATKWGNSAAVSKYYGTGSGLNYERPEFIRLIGDILKGRFSGGFVVAQTFDRCCRFGIQLVTLCCNHGNCNLIFTEDNPDKELYENISDEIIAIVGYFHAKTMGIRASKTNSVVLGDDTIREIKRLHDLGTPGSHIEKIIKGAGHRSINPVDGPISYYTIRKLIQNKKVLDVVLPNVPQKNSWEIFSEKCLIYEGPKSELRLRKSELYSAYTSFCFHHNLLCLSARKVGSLTNTIPRRYTNTGRIALVGCRLKNGDDVGD